MKTYRFSLTPLSAFSRTPSGDTLFGQLCWGIVYRFGEESLTKLLESYTKQRPFMVISDAFPKNHLPLPNLPSLLWKRDEKIVDLQEKRKELKKLAFIHKQHYQKPINEWQLIAYQTQSEAPFKISEISQQQFRNTINRQTQTTGTERFATFSNTKILYPNGTQFDLYILLDETQFQLESLKQVLQDIGDFGFAGNASTGLGKFKIEDVEEIQFTHPNANSYLSLANCAPQNLNLNKKYSFYRLTTHFGRHGGTHALTIHPFKKPIILAKAGALFTPNHWQDLHFLGNGLTHISHTQKQAVHQGYAPVICVHTDFSALKKEEDDE